MVPALVLVWVVIPILVLGGQMDRWCSHFGVVELSCVIPTPKPACIILSKVLDRFQKVHQSLIVWYH